MFVKKSLLVTIKRTGNLLKKVTLMFLLSLGSVAFISGCHDSGAQSDTSNTSFSSSKQKLVFGSDIYEPYIYYGEDGHLTGIDYDLASEACKRLGYDFEFREMSWIQKDELLESAQIDAIWSCFDMSGREHLYSWAGPYLAVVHGVLVHDDSGIKSFKDLQTRKICMQRSSQPGKWFTSAPLSVNPDKPHVKDLLMFSTPEEAFTAFEKKACDAVSGYQSILLALSKNVANTRVLDENIMSVGVGVAFYKNGNRILAEALDRTLRQMKTEGFIQKTVEKYGLTYHEPSNMSSNSMEVDIGE